jgi:NAD(P)-dependent dehydrogenase (short-subunit alcohol dehydrogenase family)
MTTSTGQIAVVTGAASGIGTALARCLDARGARLVLSDIDTDGLAAVAEELGAVAVPADVADPDDVERLAQVAFEVGPPGLVCLNAGMVGASVGPVWEAGPEEWRRVLDVNLGGVVNGLRSFVPRLLNVGDRAHVLITASLAGLLTWPGGGPYAASKHAVIAVAEQAALSLLDSDVRITVNCPGLVRTGMSPEGADPADVAEAALAAVDSGRFILMPDEWRTAIGDRATMIETGVQPSIPRPQGVEA